MKDPRHNLRSRRQRQRRQKAWEERNFGFGKGPVRAVLVPMSAEEVKMRYGVGLPPGQYAYPLRYVSGSRETTIP